MLNKFKKIAFEIFFASPNPLHRRGLEPRFFNPLSFGEGWGEA
jgi:hypothetical protein